MLQCQNQYGETIQKQERGLLAGIVFTFVELAKKADPSRFPSAFQVGL